MPTDPCLATLVRRDWLNVGPLGHLIVPYIGALRGQRYGERTIRGYVGCLAHFCHWMACDAIAWSTPEAVWLVERFSRDKLSDGSPDRCQRIRLNHSNDSIAASATSSAPAAANTALISVCSVLSTMRLSRLR